MLLTFYLAIQSLLFTGLLNSNLKVVTAPISQSNLKECELLNTKSIKTYVKLVDLFNREK